MIYAAVGSEREMPAPTLKGFEGVETIWIPSTSDSAGAGVPTGDEKAMKKAKRVLMNIKPADFVEKNGEVAFVKMYGNVLESHKEAFKAVFERLKDVQAEGGILFHCTAGKDRTGVLAALILGIVGASEDEIAEDYALTRIGVEPFRNHLVGTLLKQMGKSEEDGINEPGMEELWGARTDHFSVSALDEREVGSGRCDL
jgi:hypothetical protein